MKRKYYEKKVKQSLRHFSVFISSQHFLRIVSEHDHLFLFTTLQKEINMNEYQKNYIHATLPPVTVTALSEAYSLLGNLALFLLLEYRIRSVSADTESQVSESVLEAKKANRCIPSKNIIKIVDVATVVQP